MTRKKGAFLRRWRVWLALGLMALLTACASGPKLVTHAFSFNGFNDKWAQSVDLLAYSYGDQYRMVQDQAPEGKTVGAQSGVNGTIPLGDFLYVKWRVKATGEVLEQRVDLRDRLPRDMTDHELTFVIDGRQLYVYVVTPTVQTPWGKTPTHRTWKSAFRVTREIFPTLENSPEK